MKATPKGAVVSTRELISLQIVLEEAIHDWIAGVEAASPARDKLDRAQVKHYKPLLQMARRKWREIENTHIARQK